MTHWTKRPTITRKVLNSATLGRDVAAIVQETGAKPQTVRQVLRRAMVAGEIHMTRFRQGRSAMALRIAEKVECEIDDISALNDLIKKWR